MEENIKNQREVQFDSIEINKSLNKEKEQKINNLKCVNEEYRENSNELDNFFNSKKFNNIISYYYTTAKYLKNSKEYFDIKSLIFNSRNFIPKINNIYNYRNNYNEEYINNFNQNNNYLYEINNNIFNVNIINNPEQQIYNNNSNIKQYSNLFINNYILNQRLFIGNNILNNNICNNGLNQNEGCEKNILNGIYDSSESTISNLNSQKNIINNIDCPPFIPSSYNEKEKNKVIYRTNTNDSSSKDKETDSTSSISEKKGEEEENAYDSFNHSEKNKTTKQNLEKSEYLVEMFGRKGWICILCNNFNYETRVKCNRCGVVKKPKKIVDLRAKYEPKENIDIKDRSNKKGDWICMNCKNLNYSFRTLCNRCKIPKVSSYLNTQILKKDSNKTHNYSKYSFSPSLVIFNNMNNINNNNADKI